MIFKKLTGNECPQILTSYLMVFKLPWLHLLPTLLNVTFLGEQLKVQVCYNPPDSSLFKTQVKRKFSRPNTHCGIHEFFSCLVRQCRRRGLRGGVGELPGMNRVGAARSLHVQNFCNLSKLYCLAIRINLLYRFPFWEMFNNLWSTFWIEVLVGQHLSKQGTK